MTKLSASSVLFALLLQAVGTPQTRLSDPARQSQPPGTQGQSARSPTAPASSPRLGRPTVVEGEDLVAAARASDGSVTRQNMTLFGRAWSGNAQLLWTAVRVGDKLKLDVAAPAAGTYTIAGYFTKAPDYGRFKLLTAGKQIGTFEGYATSVTRSGRVALGTGTLKAGKNELVFVIHGKDRRAIGYLIGVDRLELTEVGRAAATPAEDTGSPASSQPAAAGGSPSRVRLRVEPNPQPQRPIRVRSEVKGSVRLNPQPQPLQPAGPQGPRAPSALIRNPSLQAALGWRPKKWSPRSPQA